MDIPNGKKIYFLSDFHLGAPGATSSIEREKLIVSFLNEIEKEAFHIFIVGDLFDFWYEYKKVVPKGFTRILGKLADLTDKGIIIHFFVGNHDMWMNDYFRKELDIKVYFEPAEFKFNNSIFYIGHGDGLGPGDHGYKMLKKVFRNPFCQWLFGILPPFFGIGLANYSSNKSRAATPSSKEKFLGENKEWLLIYSRKVLEKKHFDFIIFGHRHLPIDFRLSPKSRYINLGDWLNFFTYAVFDGTALDLRSYNGQDDKIFRVG